MTRAIYESSTSQGANRKRGSTLPMQLFRLTQMYQPTPRIETFTTVWRICQGCLSRNVYINSLSTVQIPNILSHVQHYKTILITAYNKATILQTPVTVLKMAPEFSTSTTSFVPSWQFSHGIASIVNLALLVLARTET